MQLPKVDFDREKQWWDAKVQQEELDRADERINKALRWREIERHLEGVETILDVGGATGAFSIPLARRGFSVTHVDFSSAMLEVAAQRAQGVKGIRFVEGNATDLSQFADRSFDLVLNMDGAISFCGSMAVQAIRESCRVCKHIESILARRAKSDPGAGWNEGLALWWHRFSGQPVWARDTRACAQRRGLAANVPGPL